MRKIDPVRLLAVSAFVVTLGAAPLAHASDVGQYISDAAITTRAKAAILTDPQLKATQVSVETDQGVVQLSGSVDTKDQESEAVRVVNKVDGVKSVNDRLEVKAAQAPAKPSEQ